ncbi:universal stress protein [Legionella longbeachae]|uniref:Universal stress protein n=1 Tax=Legionella longbeachae serogroup 1 (strain NSW150) TaxID=661367 RepID=D3HTK5_LEGLN|nr:universal stress protein [Legionella longbeachae]EEZ94655.1 universal stress domain protein [Legionella longbeachae D-4968]QIN35868.1 universal stress protein [Legionella longbeachae]CBJ12247.1 putative universal stress protein [Legionella longbeachae NSW150]
MYKNIMLAIDGSEVSNCAIEEIIKLSKDQDINLRIIHVVDESIYSSGFDFDYASLLKLAIEEGQDILDKATKKIEAQSTIVVEKQLLELKQLRGRVAEIIVKEAKKWPTDLLVVGTHGRRGFSRFFLGSVADNIIRIATIPVLLIRGSAH